MDRPDPAPGLSTPPPETWGPARAAARALASPILRILQIEAASGIALMVATAVALIWANSAWSGWYAGLWHTPIGLAVGEWSFVRPLEFWINDGLMTIFFLVVGLEIRREIFEGELATLKSAALPLAAALGGMLIPAGIYVVMNAGRAGSAGWAIPMATDIAFAVGVLTLLGSRVPTAWRILLLALAVIDDIGAILVIAAFYSNGIDVGGLAIAAAGLGAVLALRAAAMRTPLLYVVPGIVLWAGLYRAGIHPTLAGVILGLVTPVRPWFGPSGFAETAQQHLSELADGDKHDLMVRLDAINVARREAVSPVERLIYALHPWVAFGVMPLFALANAGVVLGGADFSGDNWWVFVGVAVGLAVGKPLGIVALTVAASRARIAQRSAEMSIGGLALVGVVGGIGFTMSLFIANLAFPPRRDARDREARDPRRIRCRDDRRPRLWRADDSIAEQRHGMTAVTSDGDGAARTRTYRGRTTGRRQQIRRRSQLEGLVKPLDAYVLMELVFGVFIGMMRAHWEKRITLTDNVMLAAEQACWDTVAVHRS